MKKLMTMISAVAVAFGLQAAAPYPSGSNFNEENWLETESETKMWTSLEGLSISTEAATMPEIGLPAQFADDVLGNNLAFKRGLADPTYRAIEVDAENQPVKQTIGANGVVVDTLIKFTPYDEDDQASLGGTNAKVAVWVKEIEGTDGAASTYQLMVTAGRYENETLVRKDYACSSKITDMDAWYRLTVKAIPDVTQGGQIPGFVVLINGETVTSGEVKKDLTGVPLSADGTIWNATGAIFPALVSNDQTLQQVGFAGQGWIDDLSITDQIPDFVETVPTFTITGGDHVESFRYNGGTWKKGNEPLIITAKDASNTVTDIVYEDGWFGDSTATVTTTENYENKVGNAKALVATVTIDGQAMPYATIDGAITAINAATSAVTLKLGADVSSEVSELSFENANATITLDLAGKTVATSIYAMTKVVITDSVGSGKVDGEVNGEENTLEIQGGKYLASKNESLVSIAVLPEGQTLVSDGNGYLVLGELGAEDGTETNPYTISTVEDLRKVIVGAEGAGKHYVLKNDLVLTEKWEGFGTYDNAANANAFEGVFDGKNHTISGVTFADNTSGNNYRGFFNQIHNATIKNLTVEGDGFGADVPSGEYGCALLVGCANDSTIENCVAKGTIASATHNVGGIAVRIKDTTIQNCTNEANLTGSYTKIGGIVVLNQGSTSACLIEGCVNKGTLTAAGNAETAGRDGLGGIVAYVGDDKLTIKDCTNEGALVKGEGAHASAKVGQVIGWALKEVAVSGAIAVRNDICTVGDGIVDGLNFARVADGVVTLVADSAAVAGESLKVMAANAPVTLAKGESITLDETLAKAKITVPGDCEVKHDGNTYTVTEKAEPPTVGPVSPGETTYKTEDAATTAAAAINANKEALIKEPAGVTDKAAYVALFEATANGTTVTVDLTAAAKDDVQKQVDADLKAVDVAGIAAAEAEETELSITAEPGLYYSVKQGKTLSEMVEGSRQKVNTKGDVLKLKATKYSGSGFYRILVNTSDK